jgi:hypothetical protein
MPQVKKRRLPIPQDARIDTYYDTQPINQNSNVVNFFPATDSKDPTRNNYISNPFPGTDTRRIAGLGFDVNRQFIRNDPDNGIDVRAIVNALKFGGAIISADQSYTQFLRAPFPEYSNFAQTEYVQARAKAYVNGEYQDKVQASAVLKGSGMFGLEDPFDVASGQNLNVKVQFGSASAFPTSAQWQASGQKPLQLRVNLYLVEIDQGQQ